MMEGKKGREKGKGKREGKKEGKKGREQRYTTLPNAIDAASDTARLNP